MPSEKEGVTESGVVPQQDIIEIVSLKVVVVEKHTYIHELSRHSSFLHSPSSSWCEGLGGPSFVTGAA